MKARIAQMLTVGFDLGSQPKPEGQKTT
jgi:hypothetical protein